MVNRRSGAEFNVVGAQALVGEVVRSLPSLIGVEGCFATDVRRSVGVTLVERSA